MKFRKKPIVIEAMLVPPSGDPMKQAPLWLWLGAGGPWEYQASGSIAIKTLEGVMTANVGDWIIRGVKGELYPCKADIFDATYEAVT